MYIIENIGTRFQIEQLWQALFLVKAVVETYDFVVEMIVVELGVEVV